MQLILYRLVSPLLLLVSIIGMPLSRKLRRGIMGRLGLTHRIKNLHHFNPIWFHFSSAGEFEQCLSVIDSVHSLSPDTQIFLSYFSPSAEGAIARESKRRHGNVPWRSNDFAPFDLPIFVNSFLWALKPRALVIVNRELWPELTHQTKKRGIPLILIAAYFPTRSGVRGPALYNFDWIGTVDENSKAYLESLGAKSVTVMGDPRIERIVSRKFLTSKPWADFFKNKVLVMGSLWPTDFLQLKSALTVLSENGWRLIFVAHEPTPRFVKLITDYGKNIGGIRRWSNFLKSPDNHSHLVVDSVGVLAELYSVASIAFVGGSFKARVHNVTEPAVYRISIITGPKIFNSAEAVEFQKRGALTVIDSGKEMVRAVETAVAEQGKIARILDDFFQGGTGIAKTYATAILKSLLDDCAIKSGLNANLTCK